ncbi:MAG: periplasmic heavy metal sensor [Armatimonadota bacterium]
MKRTMLVAVLLVLSVCVTPVWCQGKPGPGGPGGCMPGGVMSVPLPPPADSIDSITELLELTTDQAASLKDVLTSSDETIQPLLKASADASKALCDAVFASEYNAATVEELKAKLVTAQTQVMDACINAWSQIREVVTADQFTKLKAGPGGCGDPSSGTSTSDTKSDTASSTVKKS